MAEQQKPARLRWKRAPRAPGLRGMVEPTWHHYTDGRENFATVQSLRRGDGGGWFWYGMGKNTSQTPVKTAEEAKLQAQEHVKAALAAARGAAQ